MTNLERSVQRACYLLCQQILAIYGAATIGEIQGEVARNGRGRKRQEGWVR